MVERNLRMKEDIRKFDERIELKRIMMRKKARQMKQRKVRTIKLIIVLFVLLAITVIGASKMQYNPTAEERQVSFEMARKYAQERYIRGDFND